MMSIAIALGCGKGSETPAPKKAPALVEASNEPPPADPRVAESAQRLWSVVDALESGAPDLRHTNIVAALRELAQAVEVTQDAPGKAPVKLRDAAKRLESSPPSSLKHADIVKEALDIALQSLAVPARSIRDETEYRNAIAALRRSVEALDADRPLLEQRPTTAAAFRAVRGAVLAQGGELTRAPLDREDYAGTVTASSAEGLAKARAAVLELARSKWSGDLEASARALSSLADIIQATDRERRQHERITTLRRQVERLRNAEPLEFGLAEAVKAGLTTSLDALDSLHRHEGIDEKAIIRPWRRAARHAVAGIDALDSLDFQRAAVQDAFRATVDVFLVASQSISLCN